MPLEDELLEDELLELEDDELDEADEEEELDEDEDDRDDCLDFRFLVLRFASDVLTLNRTLSSESPYLEK